MSEWISVKDRAPENVRDVIVCDECGNVFSAYFTDGWPLPESPKEGAE